MKLYLTGGFLGSGKTTAIEQACRLLSKQQVRVAVITNDQGEQLVDSRVMDNAGIINQEVKNGCFCCNYTQLDEAISRLAESLDPEIIFAEAVGSCTDLLATTAKPLFIFRKLEVVISIFADASLLLTLINGSACFLNDSVQYIYKKQLEEADILVINKVDLLTAEELQQLMQVMKTDYPLKLIHYQHSLSQEDILAWINLLYAFVPQQRRSLDIDYEVYAEGEAKLAWLDAELEIISLPGAAVYFGNRFTEQMFDKMLYYNYKVGHLKFFLDDGKHQQKVSYTTMNNRKQIGLNPSDSGRVTVVVNARVETTPRLLEQSILEVLEEMKNMSIMEIKIRKMAAFEPGYPRPLHRIAE